MKLALAIAALSIPGLIVPERKKPPQPIITKPNDNLTCDDLIKSISEAKTEREAKDFLFDLGQARRHDCVRTRIY